MSTPGVGIASRLAPFWRQWLVVAAGVWSVVAIVVGALWATGVTRSPLGTNDPRAVDMSSYFAGVEPWLTGLGTIVIGTAGIVIGLLMLLLPGHRWPVIPALCLAALLLVVVPDVRVIQNFTYLFFGYIGLWDRALAAMLISTVGGLLWALASVGQLLGGRGLRHSAARRRWAVPVTYLAGALALPYPITRIAWGLGIPLGTPSLDWIEAWWVRLGLVLVFGGLPVGGALLTVGLVRPWGEVFPRWIPLLRRRRVPIWFAVIPGAAAVILITQMGLRVTPQAIVGLPTMTWTTWASAAPGIFTLPWGLALSAAVYAYAARRLEEGRDPTLSSRIG